MALPVTLSGVEFPTANYYLGPFKSSEGSFYTILPLSADLQSLTAMRATDPSDSWANLADWSDPGGYGVNINETIWIDQEGDVLHVAIDSTTDGRIFYNSFNMQTETWGTEALVINKQATAPRAVSTSHRSDGDLFVLYNGDRDKIHGTNYDRVDYAWYNGSTWNVGNDVTNATGSQDDWIGSVIIRGSDDRMHLCFKNDTLNDGYIRTLSGAATPALETMPSAIDLATDGAAHAWIPGAFYNDAGTQKFWAAYSDNDEQLNALVTTSADSPTYGTPTDPTSDNDVASVNQTIVACMCNDDNEVFIVYSGGGGTGGPDRDLFLARNDDEGGWGTDTQVIDVSANANYTSIDGVSVNLYDRDGVGTVIGVLLNDNGTIKYTEISDATNDNAVDINKSYSTLNDAAIAFGEGNYRHGPIRVDIEGTAAYYLVMLSEYRSKLVVMKATTTPTTQTNWSSQDDPIHCWVGDTDFYNGTGTPRQREGGPGSQNTIYAVSVKVFNNNLYILTQQYSGRAAFHLFNTETDTFDIRDETAFLANAEDLNATPVSLESCIATLAIRSDGSIIASAYSETSGTSGKVQCNQRTAAGVWSALTDFKASGGSGSQLLIGPDSEDRVTAVYHAASAPDQVITRSLSSANVLGTETTVDSTGFEWGWPRNGIRYGGIDINDRVYVIYVDNNQQVSEADWTSAAAPTINTTVNISDEDVETSAITSPVTNDGLMVLGLRDNGDRHLLYVRDSAATNPGDLYSDENTGSGWGTDTSQVVGTVTKITGTVYDDTFIYAWLDGTTKDYGEVALTAETDITSITELNATFPTQNTYSPPYRHSNGNVYHIGSRNGNDLVCLRATTDPPVDADFDQLDGRVIVSNDDGHNKYIISLWTSLSPDGNDIYVTTQTKGGRVALSIFEMDNNAWGIKNETVAVPFDGTFDEPPSWHGVSHQLRSDGDVVLGACYRDDAAGELRIHIYTREASIWTARGDLRTGTNHQNPIAIGPDSSDRITFVHFDDVGNDADLASVSSTNTISSVTEIDAVADTANLIVGPGVIDTSNVIYVPYIDSDNTLSVADWTSGASPTVSITTGVSSAVVGGNSQTTAPFTFFNLTIESDDTTWALYVLATDSDLYRNTDTWAGETSVVVGTVDMVSGVVNEPLSIDLDYVYRDGGTWHFGTYEIFAGVADPGPKVNSLMLTGLGI